MRDMKIYVWENLDEVEYVSKKEEALDEKGNQVTKEIIFPKTAAKKKNELTKEEKSFNDALEGTYYFRDRKGEKYVFENMTDEQKKQDYSFSIKYDSRLLVNMDYIGRDEKHESDVNAQGWERDAD